MTDKPRLIEHAFPLKEASLDSVREKNVRHGHIATLHIWRRCCVKTLCWWGGVARTSRDPPQEPHCRDAVEGPSHV